MEATSREQQKRSLTSMTLKRFVVMYLIFAVMLLCMCVPIYIYVHHTTYDNVRTSASQRLANGIAAMESSASVAINTYTSSTTDTRFRPLKYMHGRYTDNPTELTPLVQMLRSLVLPADMLADAGFVFSKNLIITRNRSFYSDTFYSFYPDFLDCEGYTFEEWTDMLEGAGSIGRFLPEATYVSQDYTVPYRAITYARTWYNVSGSSAGVYYAALNTDMLVPLMADQAVLSDGYLHIYDGQGNLLLARGEADPSGGGLEVIEAYSSAMNLSFSAGLPRAYLRAQLVPLEKIYFIYILALVAIAMMMVVFFSRRSAEPMQKLIHTIDPVHLQQRAALEASPERKGFLKRLEKDYDMVASSITSMNTQLKSHSEVIAEQKVKLADQLFDKALQHVLYAQQDRQDFAQFFPDFPRPFTLAILIYDLMQRSVDEAAQMRSVMQRLAQTELDDIYFTHTLGSDAILLVLRSVHREEMERLQARLLEEEDLSIRIVVSQTFQTENDLPAAYQQVQHINLLPTTSEVVTAGDISSEELGYTPLPLSLSSLLEMYDALSSGNDALARVILNSCADELMLHPDRVVLSRHIHSLIGYMLVQMKLEHPAVLFDVIIPSFDAKNLELLLREELPECFRQISLALLEKRPGHSDLPAQVLRFISENLFSPEMCVAFVTERLGISQMTLQKIIKNATGSTFSQYIGTQRLERAYMLLNEPGVSVQKVAELCGFSSPNSFYKAFRRKYGVAPSSAVGEAEE